MKKYKVKLTSGRVLGPIELERVRKFIARGKLDGTELAKEHPDGEWQNINLFPEISDLFLKQVEEGTLKTKTNSDHYSSHYGDSLAPTAVLPGGALPDALPGLEGDLATRLEPILAEDASLTATEATEKTTVLPSQSPTKAIDKTSSRSTRAGAPSEGIAIEQATQVFPKSEFDSSEEATMVGELDTQTKSGHRKDTSIQNAEMDSENEATHAISKDELTQEGITKESKNKEEPEEDFSLQLDLGQADKRQIDYLVKKKALEAQAPVAVKATSISDESTIVIDLGSKKSKSKPKKRSPFRNGLIAVLFLLVLHQLLFDDDTKKPNVNQNLAPVVNVFKPTLPDIKGTASDPQQGAKLYAQAMGYYVLDNVEGYKKAAEILKKAIQIDNTNIRALAMLASSYLNLIDVSNKDENYFSVIQKLIDMSRAKAVDLPETVIADVEFFITVNKDEDATQRIVKYTEDHPTYGPEMFYYLALTFFKRGDQQSAIRYIRNIPDNKAFSAKVFYIKGLISEALGDNESASQEYVKAIKMNSKHMKSRLALAELLRLKGKTNDSLTQADSVVKSPELSSSRDLARAFFLKSIIFEVTNKTKESLSNIEAANQLVKNNREYILQMYSLRYKLGKSDQAHKTFQEEAKMYYFMSEGERFLTEGKYTEALGQFLESRKNKMDSPIPLIRIGDMFTQLNNIENARVNYKLAAENAPKDVDVWSKYINVLIQSYDWEEAQKAMDKFRALPGAASTIDKLAGDMFAKQGIHDQAQYYYKKAMARDTIDLTVYVAYAKSLLATKKYDDAAFFLSLGQRLDPLNIDVIITQSKIISAAEGPDRGISFLQAELKKSATVRAELLGEIAELLIQKGDWDQAQKYVDQATVANPEYAYPFKLQAQISMNNEGQDKNALDKALLAYKSYSDRNLSDPSGFLERYRIFVRKSDFEKAKDELNRIYEIYPKYPNLHFYMASLYGLMGNHRTAIDEYKVELKNNPQSVSGYVGLGKEMIEVGLFKDALAQFTKAMTLAPRAAEPKHQAGYASYLLKNYQGAIALLQAALAFDKGNPLIYKRLGMAYREMGDGASASQAFKKYLEMEPDAPDKAQFQRFL